MKRVEGFLLNPGDESAMDIAQSSLCWEERADGLLLCLDEDFTSPSFFHLEQAEGLTMSVEEDSRGQSVKDAVSSSSSAKDKQRAV